MPGEVVNNPSRKWYSATTAGALAALVAYVVDTVWHISLPPGIESALVVVISQVTAYLIPNATDPEAK